MGLSLQARAAAGSEAAGNGAAPPVTARPRLARAAASLVIAAANLYVHLRFPQVVRRFRRKNGYWPNVAWPTTHNEKVFWRKVFDHDPRFVTLADKLQAKEYVARREPALAMPRTLWVGRSAAGVPDEVFESPVVVKTSHGCGFNLFAREGRPSDPEMAQLDRWLAGRFGWKLGEWCYLRIRPQAYVEVMLLDADRIGGYELHVEVFDGRARYVTAITDRQTTKRLSRLDREGRRLPAHDDDPEPPIGPLPACLPRCLELAERLCAGHDYLRCDFFVVDGVPYFNEFSVYPASGMLPGSDRDFEGFWRLEGSWLVSTPQRGLCRLYRWAFRNRLAGG